ncbi:hypothetical protein EW026_g5168 [Hermanssonia centrifuga]|uniref:Uncharacterized protein n=1 Tax=Hermanssonia centrifuga TaxID=98765 RepID=A0A4V3XA48_9APHY|nr:hypothetical protein EW026_g5168 [Hermanssonia centrifuga]
MSPSPLTALANLVSSSIQTLEAAYAKEGLVFPSLDEPFAPSPLDNDQVLAQTTRVLVAAAAQIIATVRPPMDTIQDYAPAMYMSATLGTAVDINLADILKNSGSQGMHIRDIVSQSGTDPNKTGRILRYLSSRHIFREVTPDVFTNNRVSSILTRAKSLAEIKKDPVGSFEGAGPAAFVGHVADEGLKSAAYISEYVREQPAGIDAPFHLALNEKGSIWDWYDKPGNDLRGRRFNSAMSGGGDMFPPSIFTKDVYWKHLTENDVVVDVGGNVGTVTMLLVKAFPKPRYIIQDIAKVIEDGKNYWNDKFPEALADGRVKLQAANFFEPQAVKGAAVYFMRLVLHDWNNVACKKILTNLRAAALPSTKLVLFEAIMPHACPGTGPYAYATRMGKEDPPYPLLANLGVGGGFATMIDMQMLALMDGQTPTIEEWLDLFPTAGWKLDELHVDGPLAGFILSPA